MLRASGFGLLAFGLWPYRRDKALFPKNVCPVTLRPLMTNPTQPNIQVVSAADYRENYANSVQVRVNVWDFFLVFGTLQQQSESQVEIRNFQGIYLSPQQAKALLSILQHNVAGYESTFGEIKLDPRMMTGGPVH
jgi:flagellar protein FlaG